jgi:hypothetical protein
VQFSYAARITLLAGLFDETTLAPGAAFASFAAWLLIDIA